MDDKDTLSGGSTNDDPFLSTDDPGGGKPPVRSTSSTMDDKDNLGGSSANDNPGSHDFSTSNQQASSDTHASRVSLILVTRDLLDKSQVTDDPGGGDLIAGLWWTDVDCAMRSYVHDCGG